MGSWSLCPHQSMEWGCAEGIAGLGSLSVGKRNGWAYMSPSLPSRTVTSHSYSTSSHTIGDTTPLQRPLAAQKSIGRPRALTTARKRHRRASLAAKFTIGTIQGTHSTVYSRPWFSGTHTSTHDPILRLITISCVAKQFTANDCAGSPGLKLRSG
jgi:hypothetical protein